jgi:hypothetical protein
MRVSRASCPQNTLIHALLQEADCLTRPLPEPRLTAALCAPYLRLKRGYYQVSCTRVRYSLARRSDAHRVPSDDSATHPRSTGFAESRCSWSWRFTPSAC